MLTQSLFTFSAHQSLRSRKYRGWNAVISCQSLSFSEVLDIYHRGDAMRLCRYALPPTGQIGFLNFSLSLLAEYRGVWLVATPFCFALSRRCRLSPIGKQPFFFWCTSMGKLLQYCWGSPFCSCCGAVRLYLCRSFPLRVQSIVLFLDEALQRFCGMFRLTCSVGWFEITP